MLNDSSSSDSSLESLSVTKDGNVFETELGSPEDLDGAFALTAYPADDRPTIVTARGEVILTVGEYKAEQDWKNHHKRIMESAGDAFNSDEDEEGDEKTTPSAPATSTKVVAPVPPALKFADGRASIVLESDDEEAKMTKTTKARKNKKPKYVEVDSGMESDVQTLEKKGEGNSGKGRKKPATASTSKKRPRSDSSSDTHAVADDEKETSTKKVRR
jgi:hypothetical protein